MGGAARVDEVLFIPFKHFYPDSLCSEVALGYCRPLFDLAQLFTYMTSFLFSVNFSACWSEVSALDYNRATPWTSSQLCETLR
jgi:hypothetical protein